MIWLEESGFLDVRREEVIRLAGRIPARGVLGSEHTISLQSLGAQSDVLTCLSGWGRRDLPQILVYGLNNHRPLAHTGCNAFDRARSDIAYGEYARC